MTRFQLCNFRLWSVRAPQSSVSSLPVFSLGQDHAYLCLHLSLFRWATDPHLKPRPLQWALESSHPLSSLWPLLDTKGFDLHVQNQTHSLPLITWASHSVLSPMGATTTHLVIQHENKNSFLFFTLRSSLSPCPVDLTSYTSFSSLHFSHPCYLHLCLGLLQPLNWSTHKLSDSLPSVLLTLTRMIFSQCKFHCVLSSSFHLFPA